MVAQSPPYALQNAQHSAALFRQAAFSPWRDASGVVASTDLAVTAQATPNMSVVVAAGRAWLKGTQVSNVSGGAWTTQGAYYGYNDAPVSLTVAAADPTNPRIDAVVAYVTDSYFSGSTNTFVLAVVTGTPAATPQVPTVPSNGLLLGTLAVAANATSITSGNIAQTGLGSLVAVLRGGWTVCTSTTRPASPSDGQPIFETDSRAYGFYEASSSKWIMYDTQWQAFTPRVATGTASNWWTQGNGTAVGRYFRKGREITYVGAIVLGTTSTYSAGNFGTFMVEFPAGYVPSYALSPQSTFAPMIGPAQIHSDSFYTGWCSVANTLAAANTRRLNFQTGATGATASGVGWNISATNHGVTWTATYETAFEA